MVGVVYKKAFTLQRIEINTCHSVYENSCLWAFDVLLLRLTK